MASPDSTHREVEDWQVAAPKARKPTAIDMVGGIYCSICQCTYNNKQEYDDHYYKHNVSGEFVYTCVVCRKEIAGYPAFRNHCYGAHVVREKFKCEHCCKKFSKLTVLNAHIDSTHTFKCTNCKETFSSKKELRTHEIIHKNEKHKPPYPCKVCNESIDSLETCELHLDRHCRMEYPCSVCELVSASQLDALSHLREHFADLQPCPDLLDEELSEEGSIATLGGILCCLCEQLFENKHEFDVHFSVEHADQEVIYTCNICGKEYNKYRQFGSHCYNHVNKDKFACVDCPKTFDRLSLLVLHTESSHGGASDDACTFSCSECGHKFGSSRRVKEHYRIVHSADTLRCPDQGCEETFTTLRQLVVHRRSVRGAGGAGGAACRHCALSLSGARAAAHCGAHARARPACPVCGRGAGQRRHALRHAAEHFGATWHVCLVCGRAYTARHRLAQHARAAHPPAHASLRCATCGASFASRARLAQHAAVHAAHTWRCARCPRTFAARSNWSKHLRAVHRLTPKDLQLQASPAPSPAPASPAPPQPSPCLPDDSAVESIDAAVIAKDWQIVYERSMAENGVPYAEVLPLDGAVDFEIPECPQEAYPPQTMILDGQATYLGSEYGPEFDSPDSLDTCCIHVGEACLRHVDPRLACAPRNGNVDSWEPLITKVYQTLTDSDFNNLAFTDLLC